MNAAELAALLEDALPQTQCTKCSFPNCRGYAEAMSTGAAPPNQCPPGGTEGIARLTRILEINLPQAHVPQLELNPLNGKERPRAVAFIHPEQCIGCTLCIQACPVDAIVGASKQMHVVLTEWCTGCDLCIPPCPVDCISMVDVTDERTGWDAWSQPLADLARSRYHQREMRLDCEQNDNQARLSLKAQAKLAELDLSQAYSSAELIEIERKRTIIAAAIARAQAQTKAAGNS